MHFYQVFINVCVNNLPLKHKAFLTLFNQYNGKIVKEALLLLFSYS